MRHLTIIFCAALALLSLHQAQAKIIHVPLDSSTVQGEILSADEGTDIWLMPLEIDCVKPFCPPDKWDDADNDSTWDPADEYIDSNGNGIWDPGEPLILDHNGNGVWDPAEFYHPYITGYKTPDDFGVQMTFNLMSSNGPPKMGWFYAVRFAPVNTGYPVHSGADVYREWIVDCEPYLVRIGDSLQLETGDMVGPTAQGLEDLINQDPTAEWDPVTGTVINSAFPISPRIIAISTFDPTMGKQGCGIGGGMCLTVGKFIVIFIEEHYGSDMVVRFMETLIPPKGDANADGVINSADVVYLINYLFKGGPAPQPLEAGDVNFDEIINSADVVYLINYLFKGGPPPSCP